MVKEVRDVLISRIVNQKASQVLVTHTIGARSAPLGGAQKGATDSLVEGSVIVCQ